MLVATDGLSKSYPSGTEWVHALKDASFKIGEGEFVAIMGPSGSGKTTLMNLLGLLDSPSSGHLELAGRNVTGFSPDERARIRNRSIGFVFQAYNLLPRSTAIENVELPLLYGGVLASERRKRAEQALEQVGLAHRRDHWPRQLSGGEQQRVAIARAVVSDPAVILADELTGALDSKTGLAVLALFQALNRAGRAIIMITHDVNVALHAARMVEMRDGIIQADYPIADRLDARAELEALVEQGDLATSEPEETSP